ncbi:sigma-70 family RNA polymerase sigma factor [Trinickia sp. LjRoot230]|uniref:RNA polymerase sigma factor n=1 Tax=Trinickia sp. LjRoot230 TaxID=3342288 RepID=UPI003ECD9C16
MNHGEDLAETLPSLLPRLWRFGLRLARNKEDAEDLVQRACVRALERRHQLQPGTSALSWTFSIMHSVWLNEVRARQIRSRASIEWHDELAETIASPDGANPESSALYAEVLAAVDELPDAQRVVMLLIAGEGLSYQEAADTLGIPIGTIMSRLARARLTIGQRFNDVRRRTARGARRIASGQIPDAGAR